MAENRMPILPRQQKATQFWPACPDIRRGMSPHTGVDYGAMSLPVGLHGKSESEKGEIIMAAEEIKVYSTPT